MKRTYSWELKRAIEKHGFTPHQLHKGERYKIGSVYWNGYWQKWYKVVNVVYSNNSLQSVTVKWEDGKDGKHCTPLDINRDWELIGGDIT